MGRRMEEAIAKNPVHECLYEGNSRKTLSPVAPYLFTFATDDPFAQWFWDEGWGKSWGVLLRSPSSLEELYRHFRKFLMVKTEEGKGLYFRFYDPRVLRVFLPTCDAQQVSEFFGPVEQFYMEGASPGGAIQFRQVRGILKEEAAPVKFPRTSLDFR
jgi:hypothetical protein